MVVLDKNQIVNKTKKMILFVDYVNKNWNWVIKDSIDVTAKKIGCSSSTINRLVKSIGYKKYSEFKSCIIKFQFKKEEQDKEHLVKHKKEICCINKDIMKNLKKDFSQNFDSIVQKQIAKLGDNILRYKNLVILYNIKGTFLASLLRHELNAIGISTITSKTEKDYVQITKNASKEKQMVSLIFADKNLSKKIRDILHIYRYKVLISRMIDIFDQNFDQKIYLNHEQSSYDHEFDLSKYILHTIFIGHLLSYIHLKKKV